MVDTKETLIVTKVKWWYVWWKHAYVSRACGIADVAQKARPCKPKNLSDMIYASHDREGVKIEQLVVEALGALHESRDSQHPSYSPLSWCT